MVQKILLASALFAAACTGFKDDSDTESAASRLSSVLPTYLDGNPTCADLGYAHELKAEAGSQLTDGQHTVTLLGGAVVTYTFSNDGKTLQWSSPSVSLDAVIVKAADGANVYAYDPESNGDSDLQTPNTSSNDPNKPQAGISHVDFCYDLDLNVVKTASTSFTRNNDWSIQKTAAETNLLLSLNQVYNLGFTVTVSPAGFTDSGWGVTGSITVTNPDPDFTAEVASVTDHLSSGENIAVDCGEGVTFPVTLAAAGSAGDTLVCSYTTGLPDGSARTNTATATVQSGSKVGTGTGSAAVTFSTEASTVNTVDGCVDVTDLLAPAGTFTPVCASGGSKTFSYSIPLQTAVCGPYQVTNTATLTSQTSDETHSSTVVTSVDVPCVDGCTLTQGYWKTHSSYGPAPSDSDWGTLADAIFYLSGESYYTVLWTAPAGNGYYVLAHQYIAAGLNFNQASIPTAVQTAYDQATVLFQTYTPAAVKALKANNADKQKFTTLAFILDQYNQGITGPGHCGE